jgi:manganese-dependent ADP-ribose/CDP-alcohol diphosphatase
MISRRTFLSSGTIAFPFIARGADKPALHLGLVADPQYADIEHIGTRFYRESIAKLGTAIEHFNTLELDFCVNAGDAIDRNVASFDPILKAFASSRHKFYHLLGNHDFELLDEHKATVPARLGMTKRYYSITQNGFCFVMLDTNDLSVYAYPTGSKESTAATSLLNRIAATRQINAQTWNGGVNVEQLKWFEETCAKAAADKQKVIVFSHHPIFPAPHNHNAWNCEVLLQCVATHRNVVAWINGHNHQGAYAVHDGVPFITLKGMVETQNTNAFSTARLFPDRLEITGHGREPSREIPFRTA